MRWNYTMTAGIYSRGHHKNSIQHDPYGPMPIELDFTQKKGKRTRPHRQRLQVKKYSKTTIVKYTRENTNQDD